MSVEADRNATIKAGACLKLEGGADVTIKGRSPHQLTITERGDETWDSQPW